jgi:mono/diheme cytochrome c family protein
MKLKLTSMVLALALGSVAQAKLSPEQKAKLPAPAQDRVQFTRDIAPILQTSCVKCHGRGKAKGGFQIDNREVFLKGGESGPAAIPANSGDSLMIEMVSGLDPENVMPQKGSKLNEKQVALLRAWIDQGITWDKEISFAKLPPVNLYPREVALPSVTKTEDPIDRILQPYFAAQKIKPVKAVDDRTYARRVYMDLWGVPPAPEDVEKFAADKRPNKRSRLVDSLLADNKHYAENWLSFWNDLLRNDYRGTGYIDGGRKQITKWLYSALLTNLPYDRFVTQLVNPNEESEGFVKGIVWRGVVNASQTPQMQAAQNISQVFMGINMKCASCHDSFINDWTLADAYGLASVYADQRLEMFQCDKPTGKKSAIKFLYPELGQITPEAPQAERRKQLAEIITSKQNGRLSRTVVNRFWQKFLGRGLVEPVDDMEQKAWSPDLLDWLAQDLADNGYDLKHTMKAILTSRAYQMPSVSMDDQAHSDFVFAGPAVRRLSAEQFRDSLGALTGVWFDTAAFQPPLAPSGKAAEPNAMPKGAKWIWSEPGADQKALAEWVYFRKVFTLAEIPDEAVAVVACDNSFTLYVNGTKVTSGKDFGQPNLGLIKSHLRKGENVIAIAGANSTPDLKTPVEGVAPKPEGANPAGLIAYIRLRSKKEVLDFGTDATWTFSKNKAKEWEKPSFAAIDWKPAAELGGASMAPWNAEKSLANTLSMAGEHQQVRSSLVPSDPLMLALGRPSREQVLTTRLQTATTLQAIELTNGDTLAKLLQRGADKVLGEKIKSTEELITKLYTRALSRKPTKDELASAKDYLGQSVSREGVEDLLWAVAMLPEFQLIY